MTAKPSTPKSLTEAELELMNVLWKIEAGSVAEVIEALPSHRKPATTTVSTILRILEQKGIVTARKEGRGHTYVPKLTKVAYEASTLKRIVTNVFDGVPVAMVRQLLDVSDLSRQELEEIQKLLQEKLR